MADEQGQAEAQQAAVQQTEEQVKQTDGGNDAKAAKQGRTYTDSEVDEIIGRKFAKWQEQQEAKVAEAAKLAEMNATQKAEYERDQLQKRLDELERREQVAQMTAESRRQLSERGISVPDDLVSHLVGDTAEGTKEAVDAFADAFSKAVEDAVKARLAGQAPKAGTAGKPLTKADIMSIGDTAERQRAIREHMELFK